MKILLGLFTLMILPSFFAQYCTNTGPTTLIDSNLKKFILAGNSTTINYVGCPGVVGLEDKTNLSANLTAGGNYSALYEFGTCGGNYAGVGQAWIDFDHSGTFDASESILTWQGTPPMAATNFNFQVPINAQNGLTRMRVIQRENGTLPINPCETFSWGSATDFTIQIVGGVDCSAYVGDDMLDPVAINAMPYSNSNNTSYCYFNQNAVYPSPDIFYLLLPNPSIVNYHVEICNAGFDTYLSAITPSGELIAYNDDNPNCSNGSVIDINPSNHDSIFIIVEGWNLQAGAYTLQINASQLGIDDLASVPVQFYPNPTQDVIQINQEIDPICLMDIHGKTCEIVLSNQHLDLHSLMEGIYFLHYKWGGKSYAQKIIKL